MSAVRYSALVILVLGAYELTSCGKRHIASHGSSFATNAVEGMVRDGAGTQAAGGSYQQSKDELLAQAKREYDHQMAYPQAQPRPLPNFHAGPGLPPPIGINFYEVSERHRAYLFCTYDVEEKRYDAANEPAWFKAALLQIRATGPQRFPPVAWVAIVIHNRAEQKGAYTFEQSFKVGAIFNLREVFDVAKDLNLMIAQTKVDRHPVEYDPQNYAEPPRWLIVEQHAAIINSSADTK